MLVGTSSSREQSLISIMLRSCLGGSGDQIIVYDVSDVDRRGVRGAPRVDISIATTLRLRISISQAHRHWRIYLIITVS